MALEIVTGYTGKPHITSQQDAILNAAALGTGGRHILNVGNQFSYEIKSNTLIRINDGYAINQGRFMGMSSGDYEELEINAGIAGTKRSDLVVIHYEKDATTGIESSELRVIEGVSGEDYVDPEYLENDLINANYTSDDLLLYRININGLNIESIDALYTIWYLDTGWREDWITQDVEQLEENETAFTHPPAIRVIGNQVYMKGFLKVYVDEKGVTFTLPKELIPLWGKQWQKCWLEDSGDTHNDEYILYPDGILHVRVYSYYGTHYIDLNESWLLY